MKIQDLSVKYYRGIDELVTLPFGEINTFVGKNDYGKSTILKALNAFFNDIFSPHDVFMGIPNGKFTEINIRFRPDCEVNKLALDSDALISLTKRYSFTPNGKLKKEFFYTCLDVNNKDFQNCWGIKEGEINSRLSSLNIEHSKSGRGITNLSKIEKINDATESFGRISLTHASDDFLANIAKQYPSIIMPDYYLFDAEQDLNISSTDFQNQFKPIATQCLEKNNALTSQIEQNIQLELNKEFDIITALMQKNVPDLEKITPDLICNWKSLVKFDIGLKFKSESYSIPILNKGTGFKRLLMVAYFEYLAQKQSNKNNIFAIEEPETFLHPELQYDLLSSLISLSENSQFFITTHSPVFAGATKDTNIIVVRKELGISKYLNHANEHEILDIVISELGIKPSYNLIKGDYRKVVFVEGKGDCLFWEHAFKKIHGSVPTDIIFIPCGGDQVDFFVNAKLCKKLNNKFIFILDTDKGAVDYDNKVQRKSDLKQKILDMGGDFEMLRKREIENYYHRNAIQRILGDQKTLPENFIIGDYLDIAEEIKEKVYTTCNTNLKTKNNMDIFSSMSYEEWIECGYQVDDTTDIQIIISKILS